MIADARSRRSNRETQLAAHLARVDQELGALERARREAEDDRASLAASRRQVQEREARLAEREAVLKRRIEDRLNEKLREARAEVDKVVSTLKKQAQTLVERAESGSRQTETRLSTGEVGGLRSDAHAALNAIGATVEPQTPTPDAHIPLTAGPTAGQTVFVPLLGAEGVVRGVSGVSAFVEVRGKRMRVKVSDLRAGRGDEPKSGTSPPVRRPAEVTTLSPTGPAKELVVIGATVDQAIDRAEKFLDDALLADERRLRIVHGYGTGRLREALTKFLRQHPLVASVGPAPDREGGGAATIVELKD